MLMGKGVGGDLETSPITEEYGIVQRSALPSRGRQQRSERAQTARDPHARRFTGNTGRIGDLVVTRREDDTCRDGVTLRRRKQREGPSHLAARLRRVQALERIASGVRGSFKETELAADAICDDAAAPPIVDKVARNRP